ncbi:unnamed protein product [Acanthoscelides obtectus]|uniref:Uncharacterized protein n=1 Tax=Acanthoscelides obtectus TaxID=200917 RepID=A0A9P0KYV8_ACAOB|nr:unnamed protein product [Acanthoscelides obtectus]CAK1677972.1 hypothetical protein AOBTE_LOCUS31688 [Acanthoscelides obtectus]
MGDALLAKNRQKQTRKKRCPLADVTGYGGSDTGPVLNKVEWKTIRQCMQPRWPPAFGVRSRELYAFTN